MSSYDPLDPSGRYHLRTFFYEHKQEVLAILGLLILIILGLILFVWWDSGKSKQPYYFSPS